MTKEQRSRRPIFIEPPGCAPFDRLLCRSSVKDHSGLPLRFAHPAKIRSSATTPVTDLVLFCSPTPLFLASDIPVIPSP
ncbi:MAG: hypothetical protein QOE88_14, partial [Verrucomicrobiota bacterium]|nr:hypothetical protein [Verrucomicrobiota bacterium]